MNRRTIELSDKINTALLLGSFLWVFDTGMVLLSRANSSSPLRALLLILIFVLAIVFPFWITQRIFRLRLWQTSTHDPSDRIWVALLAATIQLALEFIGLQVFSPGKLTMSALYGVICSFAALSEYRKHSRNEPIESEQATEQKELSDIRRRLLLSSTILFATGESIQLILQFRRNIGSRTALYLLLALIAVAAAVYLFCLAHGKCPRCGARLPARKTDTACKNCGLTTAIAE